MLGTGPPNDALAGVLATFSTIVDESQEKDPGADPDVVVTVMAERERFSRLLGELFRTGDGILVDATDCGSGVNTKGDLAADNPSLVHAVRQVLKEHNSRHPDDNLRLETSLGHAVVTGEHDLGSANTGERALREVVAALLSADLTSAALTGLLWADDSLDEAESGLVWSLLVRAGDLLRLRKGSTLVLIAGDAVLRPSVHCAGATSVRFHLHGRGVNARWPHNACRLRVRELATFDEEDAPLVVLFLGAGAVTGLGLPLGNELRNVALARQVQLHRVDSSNYESAATAFFEQLRATGDLRQGELQAGVDAFVATLTLERVLMAEQAQQHNKDSSSIRKFRSDHDTIIATIATRQARGDYDGDALVRVLRYGRRIVLVTVNFDRTVETKAPEYVEPFITEDELTKFPRYVEHYRTHGGKVPLLKLHGDIGVADSIVANVAETAAGLSTARMRTLEWLIVQIQEQQTSPWWYVGYSMRDLDLATTWTNPSFASKMSERWVAPFVDPSVRQFIETYRQARWGQEGNLSYTADERTITLIAEDFFTVLAEEIIPRWPAAR